MSVSVLILLNRKKNRRAMKHFAKANALLPTIWSPPVHNKYRGNKKL